ncbi:MAG: hypothetical protein L0154_20780, partial [Chloroflexi bacterium]|nr:hypothetical protein [Chloroflexota bacterium]
MIRYFLGVDIGSSKSHAMIGTDAGQCIGFARSGGGNHQSAGIDGFARTLKTVVDEALADASISANQIAGAGFCVAGYDWHSDDHIMERGIGKLGLTAPYRYLNDAMMGLIAGTRTGWGVSVSAGTSGNCYGRDRHGNIGRVTGDGRMFGEMGGGLELVQEAVIVMSREWSMRGPKTHISQIFMEHFDVSDLTDLMEGIARGRYETHARHAPLVFQA